LILFGELGEGVEPSPHYPDYMNFPGKLFFFGLCSVITFFISGQLRSEAQLTPLFGKNKVHYKDFKWATGSEH